MSPRLKQTVTYRFRIERVCPTYSFGAGSSFHDGPYDEYSLIEILATCLQPLKLEGRLTRFVLVGDRQLMAMLNKENPPPGKAEVVGSLTMRGKVSEFRCRVPWDMAIYVPSLVSAGAIKYIDVIGASMFRGICDAYSITFDAYDEDDE